MRLLYLTLDIDTVDSLPCYEEVTARGLQSYTLDLEEQIFKNTYATSHIYSKTVQPFGLWSHVNELLSASPKRRFTTKLLRWFHLNTIWDKNDSIFHKTKQKNSIQVKKKNKTKKNKRETDFVSRFVSFFFPLPLNMLRPQIHQVTLWWMKLLMS